MVPARRRLDYSSGVARVLSSYRWRRRLVWLLGVVVGAGTITAVGIRFSDTATPPRETPVSNEPAIVVEQPKTVRLSAEERAAAIATAARFVQTAVARKRLDESYDLAAPALRQGLTRKQWKTGAIPIVPYPVDFAKWRLDYSFRDRIGLAVLLLPKAESEYRPMVFHLELQAANSGGKRRWLVSSWAPSGITEDFGPRSSGDSDRVNVPVSGESALSPWWLLLPVGLLLLVVLVPAVAGVRDWYRTGRAERNHARFRARSS